MKTSTLLIALSLAIAVTQAEARQEKTLICHVGNELGSQGETYLENPDCEVPSGWEGEYTCPDAGKVDLIVAANASKHLDSSMHEWDGLFDYEPGEVGASGAGTEDSDGNGIDDGCEIPSEITCPCWDEVELLAVTAANQLSDSSCTAIPPELSYPSFAIIQNDPSDPDFDPDVEGGFVGYSGFPFGEDVLNACTTRSPQEVGDDFGLVFITPEEAATCVDQIAARCAEIGDPIVP